VTRLSLQADAVVLEAPQQIALRSLDLRAPVDGDVVVAMAWSGISTGTERLLWSGRMPPFPGMGYPLVPGYESVGEVVETCGETGLRPGDSVFVPGASCYKDVRGLFGGSSSRVVVPAARVIPVPRGLGEEATLLALAATAYHAVIGGERLPELIIGHGVLGRLLARIVLALDGPDPVVWETNPARRQGPHPYRVEDPEADARRDYPVIVDASGADGLLNRLIARLAHGGEIILAGFYEEPLSFVFPPAFMKEARIRIAAEFKPADLAGVVDLIEQGRLSLAGLITHRTRSDAVTAAYRTAFTEPECLKMILDWRAAP
jgi:3-hydroxyethyl bacteriochlorophyllide a dehydrogenase